MDLVALVEQARTGDVDAFTALVREHQRSPTGRADTTTCPRTPSTSREGSRRSWRGGRRTGDVSRRSKRRGRLQSLIATPEKRRGPVDVIHDVPHAQPPERAERASTLARARNVIALRPAQEAAD
jgi:hypothetical protein